MAEKTLFVEKRPQGDFAVRKTHAARASVVEPTQAEAIKAARRLDPDAPIHVARVRHVPGGNPDKYRKLR